ncbi:MAG: hypothetical protein JNL13_00185 [Chitinophagaceae bacterium]|nr:hypothetical protein [Chitinophagaceae bacterium]
MNAANGFYLMSFPIQGSCDHPALSAENQLNEPAFRAGIFVFRSMQSLLYAVEKIKMKASATSDLIDFEAPPSGEHAITLLSLYQIEARR